MPHALDALGSPLRRAILRELRAAPLSVAEIAQRMPVSRQAISRHLSVLQEAGLVELREEGTRNIYSIRGRGFASIRQFVDDFWDVSHARAREVAGE